MSKQKTLIFGSFIRLQYKPISIYIKSTVTYGMAKVLNYCKLNKNVEGISIQGIPATQSNSFKEDSITYRL